MVRLTDLFWDSLMWGIRQAISVIRFAWPYALWLFLFCLGAAIQLFALAVITSVRGLEPVAQQIAQTWTKRAIERGFPTLWETTLIKTFYGLAFVTILFSWAIVLFTLDLSVEYGYQLLVR